MEDYREEVCEQISVIVNHDLSEMTDSCKQYYLSNWDYYCDQLDIESDTSDEMYLWICSRFDEDYPSHNI